jgi:hypothetical protein
MQPSRTASPKPHRPRQPQPPGAQPTAISCLGAFRTPASPESS